MLRARLNADIISSDPGTRRDLNTDAVLLHVVEGLVASRNDGSVAPMLASGWTISPDGKTYRFALRRDVRFHNGAPLTSREVVWSLKRYLDPGTHWRCRADLSAGGIAEVRDVAAPDPYSVTITLDRRAPLFLKVLARSDCGGTGILHPASLGPDGAWRQPIGTGPFEWREWRRNQYVELARFAGYRSLPGGPDGNAGGKHALVDTLRFEAIPDGSAASAALLRGSLDVLDGLAPNELGAIQGASGIRLVDSPVMDFYGILFQTRDPLLADPRLRKAIALSIDVASLTRIATHGTGTPDSSPIPTSSPYFQQAQRRLIRRDLAQAHALAQAAGYKGQPITLITSHAPPEIYDAAIIVQAMARDAGINLEIQTLDWATHLARYSSGEYQAMLFGYSARLDPSLMFNAFVGDKQVDPRKVWSSPAALQLLRRSIETEGSERQAVFDTMEQAFRDETPAVILYNTRRVTALAANVSGYKPWPGQTQRLWDVSIGARPGGGNR